MKQLQLLPVLSSLAFTGLLTIFSSCIQKPSYDREISLLDSAATVLRNAQEHASQNTELDSIGVKFLSESIDGIRAKIHSDTVDKTTGTVLEKINNLKAMIMELARYREDHLRASAESLTRIKNLQHDLKERLLEENKAREYVVHETKALNRIAAELNLIHDVYIVSAGKVDSLRPRISALLDSLNTQ